MVYLLGTIFNAINGDLLSIRYINKIHQYGVSIKFINVHIIKIKNMIFYLKKSFLLPNFILLTLFSSSRESL